MATIPLKAQQRVIEGLKKFIPLVKTLKAKDINESDTVVVVTDILCDVFGFEKYGEITSEYAIKKTFCDLAIKIDGEIVFLIEVKAIGIGLKSDHIKQAVDYGANQGVDWVILTNSSSWKIFKIVFAKPVVHELVCEFELENISVKKEADLELIHLVCKESILKTALEDFHSKKQFLSKHFLGNLLISDGIIEILRKTIRKMNPDIKIDVESVKKVLTEEVIKRELFEGEKANDANKRINKFLRSQLNQVKKGPEVNKSE
ncbi:MAG: type I restriction enzyme HsdR N-terminal domain-containing protein [Saprospiraceae bacterium]|nr:type I restriction enzyme HsdR N-terminal domain-containing protein [Candidatus Defluviibacterium haderslevense]